MQPLYESSFLCVESIQFLSRMTGIVDKFQAANPQELIPAILALGLVLLLALVLVSVLVLMGIVSSAIVVLKVDNRGG